MDRIAGIMQEYGIPEFIWRPIMNMESGGNPESWNQSGEDSRGLFQINLSAHPQWQDLNLFDPAINAQIAAENFLSPAYQEAQAQGLTNPEDITAYVWKNGIRPYWTDEKNLAIRAETSEFLSSSPAPVETAAPVPAGEGGLNWKSFVPVFPSFQNPFTELKNRLTNPDRTAEQSADYKNQVSGAATAPAPNQKSIDKINNMDWQFFGARTGLILIIILVIVGAVFMLTKGTAQQVIIPGGLPNG